MDPDDALYLLDVLNDDPDQEIDQDNVRDTEGGIYIFRESERERDRVTDRQRKREIERGVNERS